MDTKVCCTVLKNGWSKIDQNKNKALIVQINQNRLIKCLHQRLFHEICTFWQHSPPPSLPYCPPYMQLHNLTFLQYFRIKSTDTESRAGSIVVRSFCRVKLEYAQQYRFDWPHTRSMGLSSQWNFGRKKNRKPRLSMYCSTSVFSLRKSSWFERIISCHLPLECLH